jgi:hypothetical protein
LKAGKKVCVILVVVPFFELLASGDKFRWQMGSVFGLGVFMSDGDMWKYVKYYFVTISSIHKQ